MPNAGARSWVAHRPLASLLPPPHIESMRTARHRTYAFHPNGEAPARPCDHPGCGEGGLYRAPRSREARPDYYWFCLEHVRAYNRDWDYFSGMSQEEIEAYQRDNVTGHRPTWPFGVGRGFGWGRLQDLFGLFRAARPRADNGACSAPRLAPRSPEAQALAALEFDGWVDRKTLKARYKTLVKRHHPDANGGCKKAEERLKIINRAYNFLIDSGRF